MTIGISNCEGFYMPDVFTRADAKKWISQIFVDNVMGKKPHITSADTKHDGRGGHWLEDQMKLERNSKNEPDIFGFEMKNNTKSKTTFGDWSPDYFIFRRKRKNKYSPISRSEFFKIFGSSKAGKEGRFSWSGEPFPKFNEFNKYGQMMYFDEAKNIIATYCFSMDSREDKYKIIPEHYQVENLVLARWEFGKFKNKFEKKFSKFGWFKCYQNEHGIYDRIVFGQQLNFDFFLEQIQQGKIYLDCGMADGEERPRMSWRCSNTIWDTFPVDNDHDEESRDAI